MDKKFKKIFLITILVGLIGQIAYFIYLTLHAAFEWQLIVGGSFIIFGSLHVFNLFLMKKTLFKGKELLFYAVILNPGLVSFFSGITTVAIRYDMAYIYMPAVIITVLCLFVGFGILTVALMKRNKNQDMS